LKLGDLGSANFFANKTKAECKDVQGTRSYMAPEVYDVMAGKAESYNGVKADVFSAGICIFTMVLGSPPIRRAVAS
jgi:serine/threonine protein kinase